MTTPLYLFLGNRLITAAEAQTRAQGWLDDVQPSIDLPEYAPAYPADHAARMRKPLDIYDLALDVANDTEARYLDSDDGIARWSPITIEHDDALRLALAEWLLRQCGSTESLYLPTGRKLRVAATGAVVLDAEGREVAP